MTELLTPPDYDIEREVLQNRLTAIDGDVSGLQRFLGELYTDKPQNPHILYAAASRLTSLLYLERQDSVGRAELPTPDEAERAFGSYAQLLAIINAEKDTPLYTSDPRIFKRLLGAREELVFHATLAYARAKGAEFVAQPAPAAVDFHGGEKSSDVQIFYAGSVNPDLEIQVKLKSEGESYHPRIAVLSLIDVIGLQRTVELRAVLREAGWRADGITPVALQHYEHSLILQSAEDIMTATKNWQKKTPRD